MISDRKIGLWVRAERRKRGLNQTQLAKVLKIDYTRVSRVETGERGLTAGEFLALVKRFGIVLEVPELGLAHPARAGQ